MSKLYKIGPSCIDGNGIIATKKIKNSQVIGVPLYLRYWFFPHITQDLGRLINHSWKANCKLEKVLGEQRWNLVAAQDIKKGEEITIDYRETPWFIDKPLPWYK